MVFKVILPKKPLFDIDKFEREIKETLNKTIDGVEKDFKSTYPKPRYNKRKANTRGKASVFSSDEILNYNVRGTRAHIIVPRRAKVLSFNTGYRRKVQRGKIGSSGGGTFGPKVFARMVRHPGFRGTDLDKTIANKWQPIFTKDMNSAVKKSIP